MESHEFTNLLQHKLHEIVKFNLQFLVVEWSVFVDHLRCT